MTLFNMSVDTLVPELHKEICGVDDLSQVLKALDQCAATSVPVKVNTVVMGGINDAEIPDLVAHCESRGIKQLKLLDVIKDLDEGTESFARRLVIKRGSELRELYAPLEEIAERYRGLAVRSEVRRQGGLGHPMTVLTMPSGLEMVLKDSSAGAWYGSVCESCPLFPCHDALMALRLTADLRLQFCLLREDNAVDLSGLMGLPEAGRLESALDEALRVYGGAWFRAEPPAVHEPLPLVRGQQ